jgi:RNA polymerase sigma-70 factor, ECF subfamily
MWLLGFYQSISNRKIKTEEFQEIFLEFFPELCLYAAKFVTDFDTSKDIVQDVLANFWEENDKLLNKNLIRPYLYKAVKNKALNFNKREKRKTGLDEICYPHYTDVEDLNTLDAVSEISFKNLQTDLEDAIIKLPEQRQKIFRLSRFEQMKHKEIAELLNISTKTVETQIYRSLKFLREKLNHYLD